jgi:hypothetical protein
MDPTAIGIQTRNLLVENLPELMPGNAFGNPRGDMQVAQALPERADLVRLGNSWLLRTSAVACVTALPTTAAAAYLWNGEPPTGKSYVIDDIGWLCTTSAGAASMFALLAMLNILPLTSAPSTADTPVISSLNGRKYPGRAGMGHAATVVDDKWYPLGTSANSNALTNTVGFALEVPIQGGIIVPPGYLLNLACLAANTTAAGQFIVTFHEVQTAVQL